MYSLFLFCVVYLYFINIFNMIQLSYSIFSLFYFFLPHWLYFSCHWGSLIFVLAPTETVWADTSIDFVNSIVLFKQVYQLTHKGPSLLHTCWFHHINRHRPCASGRDHRARDAGIACGFLLIHYEGGAMIHCWLIDNFDRQSSKFPCDIFKTCAAAIKTH